MAASVERFKSWTLFMSVVVTKELCRDYGSRRGISDVNLTINAGEIFGFLGPNGAGKSTAIRVLMGLLKAGHGTASIFGLDCWNAGPVIRSEVGYVAGDVRLYSWLTTRRALGMLSSIRGMDLHQNGLKLADRFRLEPDLAVRKMSRGNRQKVALVLALAHSPKLLVLDEPTSGLDPLMQDTLMLCLRELAADGHQAGHLVLGDGNFFATPVGKFDVLDVEVAGFGRGFGHNVKMFVYPATNVDTGELYSLNQIQIPQNLLGLVQFLKDNNKLEAIERFDSQLLHILSDDVLSKIKAGVTSWEQDVPENVVKAIKYYDLFGYTKKLDPVTVSV